MFREDKATALAYRFLERAGGKLNDLKLMKLMYLAERESLRRFTATITGSRFCSMMHGPVLSDAYSVMREKTAGPTWESAIHYSPFNDNSTENEFQIAGPLDPGRFLSVTELKIADQIWESFGTHGKWSLVELTHTFPEWDPSAKTNKTYVELHLATIFEKVFHVPQEEIAEFVAQAEQFSGAAR